MLEDSPADAELITFELQKANLNFISQQVVNLQMFEQQLNSFIPDIVLSDYSLHRGTGLDALQIVKSAYHTLPVIIVTGAITEETAVECMKAGAFDYILKDNLIRLVPAIENAIEKKMLMEQKLHAEKELRESERRFRGIFENTVAGLYRTTPDGQILLANPSLVNMLGFSSFDELKKKNLEEENNVVDYSRDAFKKRIEQDGQILGLESVWYKKDGSKIFVIESARAVRDDNGKTLYYEGTVEDVTERKLAQEKIKEQVAFVQQNPSPMIKFSYDGEIIIANPGTLEAFGADIESKSVFDIIPELNKSFLTKITAKRPEYFDCKVNGNTFQFTIIKNTSLKSFFMYGSNITDRKIAEEQLRDNQKLLKNFVDHSQTVTYVKDTDGRYLLINKHYEELFKIKQSEIYGKTDYDIFPKELADKFVENDKKVLINKQPIKLEEMAPHADGLHTYISIKFPLFNDSGNIYAVAGNSTDITERKEFEKVRNVLHNISIAVTQTENMEALLQEIHSQIGELMYAKNFYVCLVHDLDKNLFTFPYYRDINEEDVEDPNDIIEITSGLTYHVIKTKKILMGNRHELKKLGVIGTLPESWLGAPMITESGEVMGVIAVQNYNQEVYSEKDSQVMSIIAGNLAGVLKYKKAQAALKQSEEKFKDISFSIGDWIWEIDQDGKYTYCSDKVSDILGYSTDEVIGKSSFDFMPMEEAQKMGQVFASIIQKRESFRDLEKWNLHKDGRKICLSTSGVPIFNDNNDWIGYRGVDKDITPFKQVEREKQIFNTLVERLTNPLSLKEYAKIIAEEAYNLFDYDAFSLDIVDRTNDMLVGIYNEDKNSKHKTPQEVPTNSHSLSSIKNRDVLNGNKKLINRTKDQLQIQYNKFGRKQKLSKSLMFVPIQYEDETIGIISVQSYTDKKYSEKDLKLFHEFGNHSGGALLRARMQETLKESEEKFKKITTSAHDGIIMMNNDGKISFWNDAAEKIFGYSVDEVMGKNVHNFLVPENLKDMSKKAFQNFKTTGKGTAIGNTVELPALRKDGKEITVDLSLSAMKLQNKWCSIGIIRDVSVRKEEEKKLKEAKAELERANKYLEQATLKANEFATQAEQANKAKSEFLANMSHEIRTPMNGVIGMTGLLLDSELKPEQIEFAEAIRTSGESLLTIINDILDFSKIESGKLELEMQTFSLRECVEEALDMIVTKAQEKNIELVQLIDKSISSSIVGDVTRLRQIIINLLNNAIKFTDSGEIVLSAKAKRIDKKYHEIHMSIKDTGIGIPKDRMDRLFKSFSQVDSSTTRKYGGTGLGLTISKKLSEIMGGKMWAESEEGKGSVFHFTIKAQFVETAKKEYTEDPSPVLKGKNVLIVDDNATNRKLVIWQTESWGMNPVAVESGKEALGLLKKGKEFDLGILDMQMPEMDGMELAGEIRKLPKGQTLPLIMLTSLGKRKEDKAAIEQYFSAYLLKPIKQSQLYNAIISVFERRQNEDKYKKREVLIDSKMAVEMPLKILLAEDNVINQKVADRILQKMGYSADIVSNGEEAIKSLKKIHYDVVLMDVQMPVMDGLTATREICKKWTKDERPRIIAMTANAMKGDREMCLAAGMDDYVSKPIRVNELVKVLQENGKSSV